MLTRLSALLLLITSLTISTAAQGAPQDTVEAFLDAWQQTDYATMYSYVHSQVQQRYPQQVFENRYQVVRQTASLTGLNYTIRSTERQGVTAAVTYDVTFESAVFGQISDPGRVMRLIESPQGWRIAWTSMDILNMMAGDAQLRTQARATRRANIYDRDGDTLAADGNTLTAIYGSRQNMNTVTDCRNLLGEITRQNVLDLDERFGNRTADNVFFLGEMLTSTYLENQNRLAEFCGVPPDSGLVVQSTRPHRTYLEGNAIGHVLGYVGPIPAEQLDDYVARGYDPGALVGLLGIEQVYEEQLAGQAENVLRIVEPGGTVLRELATTSGSAPTPIVLTIDDRLQAITAQALSDAFNYADINWGSVSPGGAAVVLDVNTGGILALASYPLLNPNLFNPEAPIPDRGVALQQFVADPRAPLRNRAISEQYSPGSVYKLITAAAVLNEGLIAPDETYDCQLFWDGRPFGDTLEQRQDWRVVDEMEAAGVITPAQAVMASCNPFFWEYGALLYQRSGQNTLVDYSRRMGLGEPYGIGMGFTEAAGSLAVPQSPDVAISEAIGQANIALPPIQMAVVTAAIANGGTVYEPYVLQQIGGVDGTALELSVEPQIRGTFDFEPGVLEALQEGMCGVITDEDLGTAFIRFNDPEYHTPAQYSVCGKTGTAQTAQNPNAWFVAYAPADDPEIAIVVMVEQSLEGSQVSAPIARRIMDDYFGQAERAAFPNWWNEETFIPLDIPEGGGAG